VLREPSDLDPSELAALLERCWGLTTRRFAYLPLGFGSHHWLADVAQGGRQFVTADDLEATFQPGPDAAGSFAALERAFQTAAALRDEAGLEFVTAPLPDLAGRIIQRLGARYAVTVMPFLDGASHPWGHRHSPSEQRELGALLGRLHRAGALLPADRLPRRHDLAVPSRATLEAALADLHRPWETGPYAEPTRRLLADHADVLARRLAEYDARALRIGADDSAWVVTHGEPHEGNVVRGPEGSLHLVDWDTTLLAPRERDLGFVLDDELSGWDEYAEAAGGATLDEEALRLFRDWWVLSDVAVFVAVFRRPHVDDENTAASWRSLEQEASRAG
jgi:spectinomycin phosphotransferase